MPRYDLLLKGGTVLDPGAGLGGRLDVAIAGGRIAAVAAGLPPAEAGETRDVSGHLVLPGLIDFHTHVFWGGTALGVEPDRDCLPRGVTTVVDGGSAGAHTFAAFRQLVAEPARSRVLCYLHMSLIGQIHGGVGELTDLGHVDTEATARVVAKNRDLILGLKLRVNRKAVGANSLRPLQIARELADRLAVPIMVHIGDSEAPLPEILALLGRGDIVTHIFTPHPNGILDGAGRVLPEVWQAMERGVIFDTAQGRINLGFRVARAALAQGLVPHVLSTDVTTYSLRGEIRDLPRTMSRFLALGLSLEQVVARTTAAPAAIMGLAGEIGTLKPGAVADVTVADLVEGEFEFGDSAGEKIAGHQYLTPRLVFRAGENVPVTEIV